MTSARSHTLLLAVAVAALFASPAQAQNVDWRLHNLDLHGSRYAEIDQITPENAHRPTPRCLSQHGVIDGVSNRSHRARPHPAALRTDRRLDRRHPLSDRRNAPRAVTAHDRESQARNVGGTSMRRLLQSYLTALGILRTPTRR